MGCECQSCTGQLDLQMRSGPRECCGIGGRGIMSGEREIEHWLWPSWGKKGPSGRGKAMLSHSCPGWSLPWVLSHRATAQALEWRVGWASGLSCLESYFFLKTWRSILVSWRMMWTAGYNGPEYWHKVDAEFPASPNCKLLAWLSSRWR